MRKVSAVRSQRIIVLNIGTLSTPLNEVSLTEISAKSAGPILNALIGVMTLGMRTNCVNCVPVVAVL